MNFYVRTSSDNPKTIPIDYRCRNCNSNLASDNPASQYQRQKLIQNTVRIPASLWTMNLAALASYNAPLSTSQFVEQAGAFYEVPAHIYWNQMSDRARPSVQKVITGSGATYGANSLKRTKTSLKPGAMSPGGIGVDIKHNCYERRLNRLKAKGPIRRGVIPPNYGTPIPFNPAFPIYGGKIVKTGIVNGCNCDSSLTTEKNIYENTSNAIQDLIFGVTYKFSIGETVWVRQWNTDTAEYENIKGEIIEIIDNQLLFVVKLFTGSEVQVSYYDMLIYYNCDCSQEESAVDKQLLYQQGFLEDYQADAVCSSVNVIATSDL